jgi:hypothetical protein
LPHRNPFLPTEAERVDWRRINEHFKQQAQSAMTVKQALEAMRTDRWRWSPDFYRPIPPLGQSS